MNKKLIALVLAFAMVFSSFTAAFADTTTAISVDAQAVKDLGMLVGEGQGVTAAYLATTPSRLNVAIMFLRLKGLESAALSYTSTNNFADASQVKWAGGRNVMAYLKNNPQLGFVGIGANKLDPNAPMDSAAYYKVMLEALGYKANTTDVIGDFTYAGVKAFAATKGLSKVATVNNFTANDLAIATIEALKATVKGGTKTLATTLVESGVITADAAVLAGVYTKAPVALAVASVTMNNLKQLVVNFNKAVDKNTVVVANFTIAGANASAVTLSADNKSVTVTIADAQVATTQPANYALVVKNVKDAAGVALAQYSNTLRVFDNTIPTVQNVALVAPNKFEITFSEPIKTAGTVKVNNGIYGVSVPVADGSNKAIVTLLSTLAPGNYSIAINGYADYAGFSMDSATASLIYVKDATIPTAIVKEATQTSVVVEFNKSVTLDTTNAGGAYEDYFYHTFSAWTPDSVVKNADNKTYTLTFNTYPIPAGTTNLVVKAKGTAGVAITDEWGNKAENNIVLPVTVAADTTAPAVKEVKVTDESTVVIYFTEDMDQAKAENVANYVVKDSNSKAVTTAFAAAYTEDASKNEYKVTLSFAPTKLAGGNYTVEVKGLEDEALAVNALATVTLSFTITDLTAINPAVNANDVVITAVESATADVADIIYVTYGEKMITTGQYSVLAAGNYLLAGAALPEGTTLQLFGSTGKVVKITIPKGNAQAVVGANLTIGRVADLAGNVMVALSYTEAVGVETAPTVTAVKQTDYNKLTVTVNKPLATVVASGFTTASGEVASIDSFTINSNNETIINVTIIGIDASSTTNTSAIIAAFNVVADKLVAETGVKMQAQDASALIADARVAKLIATNPIIDGAAAGTIEVKFTEALAVASQGLYAHDLVITNAAGNVLVAGVDYTTTVTGSTLVISGLTNQKYTIKSKDSITYIVDAASVKAAAFTNVVEVTVQ